MGEGAGADLDILLAEDNPGDIRLVKEALDEPARTIHVTRDGKEALDFLHQRNEFTDVSRPDIILLDLNLPKVDGAQVFDEIQRNPELSEIRLLILTSAPAEHADIGPEEIKEENFITKPTDPDMFMTLVRSRVIIDLLRVILIVLLIIRPIYESPVLTDGGLYAWYYYFGG